MEDNFYLDDFELSLKEQANQFKMVPSKRVWHGIYNDMHPGRRWPSVTIALILVFSIVFVGYINTHNDGKSLASNLSPAKIDKSNQSITSSSVIKDQVLRKPVSFKASEDLSMAKSVKEISSPSLINTKDLAVDITPAKNNIQGQKSQTTADVLISENAKSTVLSATSKPAGSYLGNHVSSSLTGNSEEANDIETTKQVKNDISSSILSSENLKLYTPQQQAAKFVSAPLNINSYTLPLPNNEIAAETTTSNNTSSTSSQNVTAKSARNKNYKTTWVYYGGISLNTVSFDGSNLNNINQNAFSLPQVRQKDNKTIHNPALGFEAGVQVNYLIAKKLELTAGARFTRSGYNIVSNEVHPTLTSLLLKDKSTGDIYSRNFVTHYGDGTGQSTITLHNYSFQASIPLGVQYQLLGNSKIQFNLGANIEPSFVLKSNAYILSTDGRNYVNIPDLSRKWNLSSNLAPFITFKASNFKWNIGPEIRYQWLSTYLDDYTIKEHLINYGLRVGISK